MAYANVINEPVKDYKPGSEERKTLLKEYERPVSYTHLTLPTTPYV